MSLAQCQQMIDGVGSGIAASLRGVDCAATATAQAAFGRLLGTNGALMPALTILLTLSVAFFAISLLTGRSRIGVSTLTPRMITLGMVLTFATSWVAYQGVVWNLAVGAPDQIAGLLTGTKGSATINFADKMDAIFSVLIDSSDSQVTQGTSSAFSPPGLVWLGGTLLLLSSVGLLATCKIALGVLLALGPVFVVLALFPATRGLFTGWLKSTVMMAITPLFAVLAGSLMLELAVPVLRELVQSPDRIEPRAAMAFFMIGAINAALMSMVLKVAGTMIAGWRVFGLANPSSHGNGNTAPAFARPAPATATATPAHWAQAHWAQALPPALAPSRQIRLAPQLPALPAPDSSSSSTSTHPRAKTVTVTATAQREEPYVASFSRARGIGSRFRPTQTPVEPFRAPEISR